MHPTTEAGSAGQFTEKTAKVLQIGKRAHRLELVRISP